MTIKNKIIAAVTVIAVIIMLAIMFPAVVHNVSNDLIYKR